MASSAGRYSTTCSTSDARQKCRCLRAAGKGADVSSMPEPCDQRDGVALQRAAVAVRAKATQGEVALRGRGSMDSVPFRIRQSRSVPHGPSGGGPPVVPLLWRAVHPVRRCRSEAWSCDRAQPGGSFQQRLPRLAGDRGRPGNHMPPGLSHSSAGPQNISVSCGTSTTASVRMRADVFCPTGPLWPGMSGILLWSIEHSLF